MAIFLLQIFLLLLGAFLLGATSASLLRRALSGRSAGPDGTSGKASNLEGSAPGLTSDGATRYARALTGDPGSAVPQLFQPSSAPVIDVQPIPKSAPTYSKPVTAPAPVTVPTPPRRLAVPPSAASVPSSAAPSASPQPGRSAPPQPAAASAPLTSQVSAALIVGERAAPRAAKPAAASQPPASAEPLSYSGIASARALSAEGRSQPAAAEPPIASDDLTRIRAIDIDTQKRLRELGVRRFDDIAKWTSGDVGRVSRMLGHVGRIEQENWIEQAQILAKGGDTDYSRRRSATRVDPANPAATVAGAPTTSPGPDRLNRIFGIDAQTEKLLVTNGITRFTDIAGWAGTEVEKVETLLGRPGRVGLENWIEQAKVLSRGVNGEAAPVASLADASREVVAIPAAAPLQAPRPDFSGLRSVRSEALRSEPVGAIPPAVGFSDDLKRIRGIGVLIEKKLNSLGVTAYEQVANWTGADIDRVSQILDFKGRIERENWVEQARILASGGQTEFSRRLDRVEIGIGRDHRG